MTMVDQPKDPQALVDALRMAYRSGVAPRIGFGDRPAILVVDLARGWTDAASPMALPLDAAVAAAARLIEAARPSHTPVIFTTFELPPGGSPDAVLVAKSPRVSCMERGSLWVEVDPRLPRRADDMMVAKPAGSAFFETPLAARLRSWEIDTLLICGCVTSGCVRASAVDAAQHGFRPIVVREAVGDRSALAHEANLLDIDQRYGDVVSIEEAVRYLSRLSASGRRETDAG